MNPQEEFEDAFNEAYDALLLLLDITNQPPLPPVNDVLGLTVTEFTQVIEDAKQAVRNIPPEDVEQVLIEYSLFLPADARAFLQAVADEDYDTAFAPLDAIVAEVSQFPADAVLRDVIEGGDEGGSGGGDGGSGGGDGGGDGGDGGDGGRGKDGYIRGKYAHGEVVSSNIDLVHTGVL